MATASEQNSDPHPNSPRGSGLWKWVVVAAVVALLAIVVVNYHNKSVTDSAHAQLDRSLQAYQAGQYQDAINAAQAALDLKPESALAYNNLAVSYLGLHKFDDAIHNAQEALRIQPDFELAKNNLAWIQREKEKANTPPPAPGTAAFYMVRSSNFGELLGLPGLRSLLPAALAFAAFFPLVLQLKKAATKPGVQNL